MFVLGCTILSLSLIVCCKTLLNQSLAESYVHGGLFFLDCLITTNVGTRPIRRHTLQLTAHDLQGFLLFLKTFSIKYRGTILLCLLQSLPVFLKGPLYKTLLLLLLQPLPSWPFCPVHDEDLW